MEDKQLDIWTRSRAQAFEEAARVCDAVAAQWATFHQVAPMAARECAAKVREVGHGALTPTAEGERRRGYMCQIAFDEELGVARQGTAVYPSVEALEAAHPMADDCGVVAVEVTCTRVVQPARI